MDVISLVLFAILEDLGQQIAVTGIRAHDFTIDHDINNHSDHVVHPATAGHIGTTSSTA